ncbi:hypothetical protein DPMN_000604 [Dreissena polymorpha]|uniref:Uncharacterized protein n=1 Tax=Dreissena polymorpha TaxID=45954 RepID=A0A9D4MIK3_DREPO|nr:hypothetical protein DPMN_000604 [Dreissena polymorpha]
MTQTAWWPKVLNVLRLWFVSNDARGELWNCAARSTDQYERRQFLCAQSGRKC